MRRRTHLGELSVAAALAALLAWLFWPAPVAVEVAEAVRGRIAVTTSAEGIVRVKQLYVVAAPLAGRLHRITLEPGDAVLAGEAVALLSPTLPKFLDARGEASITAAAEAAEAAAQAAKAAVAAAQAAADFAADRWRRVEILAARGVAAPQERDRARTTLATRQAELSAAQADNLAARHRSERLRTLLVQPDPRRPANALLRVTAPASGRVLQVLQDSETIVPPGTPLLTLGDGAAIEVVVELPSEEAAGLRPGLPATLVRWGGAPLPGRVARIEPAGRTVLSLLGFEEQRVAVVVDVMAPPAAHAGLAHGFRIDVHIERGQGEGLTIPLGALVRHDGGWSVYAVDTGTARSRAVRLGRRTQAEVEVLDGLAAGERVVVHPGEYVADGVAVRVR